MQFHLNGYDYGDPMVKPADPRADASGLIDVLIIGTGPAGLTLAAQLARFPTLRTRIIEQRDGPLMLGQADATACRNIEMFQAFGFAEEVLREAHWINETTFWAPDPEQPECIKRDGRAPCTEEGISEFPYVLLNQARVQDYFLEQMRNAPTRLQPTYGTQLVDLQVPEDPAQPVQVTVQRTDAQGNLHTETLHARYVVGCDGARSKVRAAIGQKLIGDSANQAWGVMDILADTNFPDVRLTSTIHSINGGNILVIAREGGYLLRLYVEMDKLGEDERVAAKNITADTLIAAAQRILHPYTLNVKEVAWWSVYEIGQRLCHKFDDVPAGQEAMRLPRVFIAGDACHTHSPKAGQGMNVSMQDTFNLGWKLAAVIQGQAAPDLLHTYSRERQQVAQDLIDFDRDWSRLFSAKPKTSNDDEGVDPHAFQRMFSQFGRFRAGVATQYQPSSIVGQGAAQSLASGLPVGMRLHSAPVIRVSDAKPMQLGHVAEADGRWRLYLFADERGLAPDARLSGLCKFLETSADSPVRRYTPSGADLDAVFDVRAVFQTPYPSIHIEDLPALLLPRKGKYGLKDYEKAFCVDPKAGDIFALRGIDRANGCMVVVRPDQFVAHVLPLDAHGQLTAFFASFMKAM